MISITEAKKKTMKERAEYLKAIVDSRVKVKEAEKREQIARALGRHLGKIGKDWETKPLIEITEQSKSGQSEKVCLTFEELWQNAYNIKDALEQQEFCHNECKCFEQCTNNGFYPYFYGDAKNKYNFVFKFCDKLEIYKRKREKERLVKNSKIPKIFCGKTFEDFIVTNENKNAYLAAKDFVENPQFSLYIFGDKGLGKTMLLSIMANALIEAGKNVLYVCAPDLAGELKEAINRKNEYETLNFVSNADILIIDDLGAEKQSDWLAGEFYKLFNTRYNNGAPTVISSNLSFNNLIKHFKVSNEDTAGRIVNRIIGTVKPVLIRGTNKRLN